MMYKVKEIYKTIQGEGAHAGRTAVFCRFTGCNLWSGREEDRAGALCSFCDTDFMKMNGENGGKYDPQGLVQKIKEVWNDDFNPVYVVITGGEPLLQLKDDLIQECKANGIYIALETNGTLPVPQGIDWICMSPKPGMDIVTQSGNEIKVVYPQSAVNPLDFKSWDFEHFYIQPLDNQNQDANIKASLEFCLANPQWKLSLQTHKLLGIA